MAAQINICRMLVLLALIVFAGLLIYAAASDVTSYTIPNWVSIALVVGFTALALALGMPWQELGWHFLFGFAVLIVGFFLFQARVFGAGDAKLIAATALWTGIAAFTPFIFWTAAVGGLLAASLLAARQFIKQTETNPPFVNRLLKEQQGIPYGLAIMAGGLMSTPVLFERFHSLTLP